MLVGLQDNTLIMDHCKKGRTLSLSQPPPPALLLSNCMLCWGIWFDAETLLEILKHVYFTLLAQYKIIKMILNINSDIYFMIFQYC